MFTRPGKIERKITENIEDIKTTTKKPPKYVLWLKNSEIEETRRCDRERGRERMADWKVYQGLLFGRKCSNCSNVPEALNDGLNLV